MYTKQNRLSKLSLGFSLSIMLVACGGGGGSDDEKIIFQGSNDMGCIDGGAPLTGNTTVVVWDGNLCVTDGEGVNLLRDLKGRTGVSGLLKVGDVYYFTGEDTEHGEELWITDGTKSGTVLVKDINPGTSDSIIRDMTSINGVLYFAADDNDDNNHRQLWQSDGTEAGTMIVKEISFTSSSTGTAFSAGVDSITKVNEKLYFSAFSGVLENGGGQHLWESDGTEAGTKQVSDSITNVPSNPMFLNSGGDKLFFMASDLSSNSLDLWVVDAINATATNLQAFNGYDIPHGFVNIDDTFYLLMSATAGSSNKELWVSDGTMPGTEKIKDIPSAGLIKSIDLVNVNGTLYFSSHDNGSTGTADLWKSDGTAVGTMLVKNDTAWTFFGAPVELTEANSQLFFSASNNANILFGNELWISDGTTDGTRVLKDFRPSSDEGSDPEILGVLDNNLLFEADEEDNSFGGTSTYLWKTDGTEAGTIKIQKK